MKITQKLFEVDDGWFYSNPHPLLRLLTIYVKGDMIILLPLFSAIGFIGLWSIRFMLLVYALFYTVRSLGEVQYWISQQFGPRNYRPYDFGFKKVKNDAIYIIYQLIALATMVIGLGCIAYIILYLY